MTTRLVALVVLFLAARAGAETVDTFSDTWVATDALGRKLPTAEQVGAPRRGRFVAMFYFLWHEAGRPGPFDVTKILAADPAAMLKPTAPPWGPLNAPHHWGESLFGYYLGDDEFVLRKHAQMLADAGVDVIVFDTSNRLTYPHNYRTLLNVFHEMRELGNRTPQVAFLTPFGDCATTVQQLWDDLYAPRLFEELWFRWDGKPLILANPKEVHGPARDFFTFRRPQPDYFQGPTEPDMWSWLEVFPQHVFKNSRGENEQMSVGVAQNAVDNRLGSMSEPGARGRSFHGDNYAEQWEHALKQDPQLIFITGWNEWIAGRFDEFNRVRTPPMFVDEFDREHSRDIEPMKGGHGDNYYYQTVAYIRRFKGARTMPPNKSQPIAIDGSFDDWKNVAPEYRDTVGDTVHRNHPGWGSAGPFVNDTGRNDIVAAKISYDEKNVYFYVRTKDVLTPSTDPNWMRLLAADYLFRAEAPGPAKFAVGANEMEVSVPRTVLGVNALPATIDFKWIDNIPWPCSPEKFSTTGDAAPNDRFYYRAILGAQP